MFSGCACVLAFVRVSRTLLILCPEKYWTYFHQTFSFDAISEKDRCFNFGGQKVIVQGHGGSNMLENALLAFNIIDRVSPNFRY